MNKRSKIYVAGHGGLVGSALMRRLVKGGYTNIITRSPGKLDLRKQDKTKMFFGKTRPEYVFLAAAKVGGILANSRYAADFIYDNIMIAANVINAAYGCGVKKLLNLGSSCIYPRLAPQPIKERYLLTGSLEPTNEAYAIAKIAALKLCKFYNDQHGTNFISIMPANLYGPNDNFDHETAHVIPSLIRRFHLAKMQGRGHVTLWGSGKPARDFLYVDDLADAAVFLMERYSHKDIGEIINIGTGEGLKIRDLADIVKAIVGFKGEIRYDTSKPDGMPRRVLDISKIEKLGWRPKTSLKEGVNKEYEWYKSALKGC